MNLYFISDISDGVFDRSYLELSEDFPSYNPDLFEVFEDDFFAISEEGEEVLEEWQDDSARGYDLCNGRAYGLADRYRGERAIFQHLKDNYSVNE